MNPWTWNSSPAHFPVFSLCLPRASPGGYPHLRAACLLRLGLPGFRGRKRARSRKSYAPPKRAWHSSTSSRPEPVSRVSRYSAWHVHARRFISAKSYAPWGVLLSGATPMGFPIHPSAQFLFGFQRAYFSQFSGPHLPRIAFQSSFQSSESTILWGS